MCLIDNRKFRISLREKVCYKILICVQEDENNILCVTPRQRTSVILKKNKTNVLAANDKRNPLKSWLGDYEYSGGFIHAYTDVRKAQWIAYSNNLHEACCNPKEPLVYKVFKCIIPRFTRYGYNKENQNICARKMIVKERIY